MCMAVVALATGFLLKQFSKQQYYFTVGTVPCCSQHESYFPTCINTTKQIYRTGSSWELARTILGVKRYKEIQFISIKVTYYSLIILVIIAFGPKLLVYTHTLIHIPYNPAFLHMTVLCCLQFPPFSPANIYILDIPRSPRGKKERKREGLLYYNWSFCTNW